MGDNDAHQGGVLEEPFEVLVQFDNVQLFLLGIPIPTNTFKDRSAVTQEHGSSH